MSFKFFNKALEELKCQSKSLAMPMQYCVQYVNTDIITTIRGGLAENKWHQCVMDLEDIDYPVLKL